MYTSDTPKDVVDILSAVVSWVPRDRDRVGSCSDDTDIVRSMRARRYAVRPDHTQSTTVTLIIRLICNYRTELQRLIDGTNVYGSRGGEFEGMGLM